jgi:hypothetical protein
MNLYSYFWDGGIWNVYAETLDEARQLVFDIDRIPYDIIRIDNVYMEVTNAEEIKTVKSKQSIAVVCQADAGQTSGHEAKGLERLVV